MKVCTTHPHSSQETARKCYEKRVGAKGNRVLRTAQPFERQFKVYNPPKTTTRGAVQLLIFSEDLNTPY